MFRTPCELSELFLVGLACLELAKRGWESVLTWVSALVVVHSAKRLAERLCFQIRTRFPTNREEPGSKRGRFVSV